MRSTQVVRNTLRRFDVGFMVTNKRANSRTVKCYLGEFNKPDELATVRGAVLRDLRKAGFRGCRVDTNNGKFSGVGPAFIVRLPMDY